MAYFRTDPPPHAHPCVMRLSMPLLEEVIRIYLVMLRNVMVKSSIVNQAFYAIPSQGLGRKYWGRSGKNLRAGRNGNGMV